MNNQTITLAVEGMSCEHCVHRIQNVVGSLNGVSNVEVDLKGKTVTVVYDTEMVRLDTIKAAIEDQGYEVK